MQNFSGKKSGETDLAVGKNNKKSTQKHLIPLNPYP